MAIVLSIEDGTTVPSTEIYGNKTYIDIGSGNVFKLSWYNNRIEPIVPDSEIDFYKLFIRRYDTITGMYYPIFEGNIGKVTEFCVNSALLTPVAKLQYQLIIFVVAVGKYGTAHNLSSNVVSAFVCKGSGSYVKVSEDYNQPIMKRAVALANIPRDPASDIPDDEGTLPKAKLNYTNFNECVLTSSMTASPPVIFDADLAAYSGVLLKDTNGTILRAKVARILNSTDGWNVMCESYSKDEDGHWQRTDIKYEVLVDSAGEIITDATGNPIYVL